MNSQFLVYITATYWDKKREMEPNQQLTKQVLHIEQILFHCPLHMSWEEKWKPFSEDNPVACSPTSCHFHSLLGLGYNTMTLFGFPKCCKPQVTTIWPMPCCRTSRQVLLESRQLPFRWIPSGAVEGQKCEELLQSGKNYRSAEFHWPTWHIHNQFRQQSRNENNNYACDIKDYKCVFLFQWLLVDEKNP